MYIEEIINKAVESNFAICYPIEKFTIYELDYLSKLAKENNINLKIETKCSNSYQGTVIAIQRNWDTVEEKLKNQESDFEIRVFDNKNNKVAYKKLTKYQAAKLIRIIKLKWT